MSDNDNGIDLVPLILPIFQVEHSFVQIVSNGKQRSPKLASSISSSFIIYSYSSLPISQHPNE